MQTKQYKSSKFRTFKPGDLVYLYTPALGKGVSKKLSKPWTDLCVVLLEELNEVNLLLKLKDGRIQVVHINQLKLFPPGRDIMAGKIRHPRIGRRK